MTPDEAASWIAAEVRSSGYLDHAEVIDRLENEADLVGYNDAGNSIIAKSVLTAFGKLNATDIVWSRSGQHWRLRESGDPAGRLAD